MFTEWFGGRSPKRVGFDDVLFAVAHPEQILLMNTLPSSEQDCLIRQTLSIEREEAVINKMLTQYETVSRKLILYGKNATDPSVDKKYWQLMGLGISDVYLYSGGLFEWMLLQDIYGEREFPTTKKGVDILKYKPLRVLSSSGSQPRI